MAQGSHSTLGGWEPKLCSVCSERVTLSGASNEAHGGAAFHYHVETGQGRSLHSDCAAPTSRLANPGNTNRRTR